MALTDELKSDWAKFCELKLVDAKQKLRERREAYGPWEAGRAEDAERWQARLAAARRGEFLLRGSDAYDDEFTRDETCRKYKAAAIAQGLVDCQPDL
jgi:hypothetical protein